VRLKINIFSLIDTVTQMITKKLKIKVCNKKSFNKKQFNGKKRENLTIKK
jgi:hypothetical protein